MIDSMEKLLPGKRPLLGLSASCGRSCGAAHASGATQSTSQQRPDIGARRSRCQFTDAHRMGKDIKAEIVIES